MTTEWKVGDRLRITDDSMVYASEEHKRGAIHVVAEIAHDGTPVTTDGLVFYNSEMLYVERVCDEEDTTARNAELGEPSPECNCSDLADIREELTDIKSMIGRLLQREQAEVDALYGHRLNGVNFATGAELAEKASAIIDGEESE